MSLWAYMLRLGVLLSSLAPLGACDDVWGIGTSVDLGQLRLHLWEPARIGGATVEDDTSLWEDASDAQIQFWVDGVAYSQPLNKDVPTLTQGASETGSDVRLLLQTTGRDWPDAIARSDTVTLTSAAARQDLIAVLAPPSEVHRLADETPFARTKTSSCAAPDGRAWLFGGKAGDSDQPGGFLLDPRTQSVTEGPLGLSARSEADCAADASNGVFVFGGCDGSGVEAFPLLHSAQGSNEDRFEVFSPTAMLGGCGARVGVLASGNVVLIDGDKLQVLGPDGARLHEASLASPRHHAQFVQLEENGSHVLLVGGFQDVGRSTASPGATHITLVDGGLLQDEVTGIGSPLFDRAGTGVALVDGIVQQLDVAGKWRPVPDLPSFSLDDVSDFIKLAPDLFAALSALGDQVELISSHRSQRIALTLSRAQGQLVRGPGGALLVWGGGVSGIDVVTTTTDFP